MFYALKTGSTADSLTWAVRTVSAYSSWDSESVLEGPLIAICIITVAVLKLMGSFAEAEPLLAMIERHAEVWCCC